jgi:hypothetical protein
MIVNIRLIILPLRSLGHENRVGSLPDTVLCRPTPDERREEWVEYVDYLRQAPLGDEAREQYIYPADGSQV